MEIGDNEAGPPNLRRWQRHPQGGAGPGGALEPTCKPSTQHSAVPPYLSRAGSDLLCCVALRRSWPLSVPLFPHQQSTSYVLGPGPGWGQGEPTRRGPSHGATLGSCLLQHLLWAPWDELGRQRSTRELTSGHPSRLPVARSRVARVCPVLDIQRCRSKSPPPPSHLAPHTEPLTSATARCTAGPGPEEHPVSVTGPGLDATLPAPLGHWDKLTLASVSHPKMGDCGEAEHQGPEASEGPSARLPTPPQPSVRPPRGPTQTGLPVSSH